MTMMELTSDAVTPAPRALFCTDEPVNPTWAMVWEPVDGVTYFEGQIDRDTIAAVFGELRKELEALVGCWLTDTRQQLLPPDPYYDGRTLEFYDRSHGRDLDETLHRTWRRRRLRGSWDTG